MSKINIDIKADLKLPELKEPVKVLLPLTENDCCLLMLALGYATGSAMVRKEDRSLADKFLKLANMSAMAIRENALVDDLNRKTEALRNLYEACMKAEAEEALPTEIHGSLLDAARVALGETTKGEKS